MVSDCMMARLVKMCEEDEVGEVEEILQTQDMTADVRDQAGRSPIHVTAITGNPYIAKMLLQYGAKANCVDGQGWTPLMNATVSGHTPMVSLLLEHQAHVAYMDMDGTTSLYLAAQQGYNDIVELLLKYHAPINTVNSDGWTPLHIACQNGHFAVVKLLLSAGRNEIIEATTREGLTALFLAVQQDHTDIVKYLIGKEAQVNVTSQAGYTPFHHAVQNGNVDVVNLLIKAGTVVLRELGDGVTTVYLAAQSGNRKVLRALLATLAKGQIDNGRVSDGFAPLHIAAQCGHYDVIKTLIDYGADVTKTVNDGATALFIVAQQGHNEVVRALLAAKSNINAKRLDGYTPVHACAENGHASILQLLIDAGADLNTETVEGKTPLELAIQHEHQDIFDLLRVRRDGNVHVATTITTKTVANKQDNNKENEATDTQEHIKHPRQHSAPDGEIKQTLKDQGNHAGQLRKFASFSQPSTHGVYAIKPTIFRTKRRSTLEKPNCEQIAETSENPSDVHTQEEQPTENSETQSSISEQSQKQTQSVTKPSFNSLDSINEHENVVYESVPENKNENISENEVESLSENEAQSGNENEAQPEDDVFTNSPPPTPLNKNNTKQTQEKSDTAQNLDTRVNSESCTVNSTITVSDLETPGIQDTDNSTTASQYSEDISVEATDTQEHIKHPRKHSAPDGEIKQSQYSEDISVSQLDNCAIDITDSGNCTVSSMSDTGHPANDTGQSCVVNSPEYSAGSVITSTPANKSESQTERVPISHNTALPSQKTIVHSDKTALTGHSLANQNAEMPVNGESTTPSKHEDATQYKVNCNSCCAETQSAHASQTDSYQNSTNSQTVPRDMNIQNGNAVINAQIHQTPGSQNSQSQNSVHMRVSANPSETSGREPHLRTNSQTTKTVELIKTADSSLTSSQSSITKFLENNNIALTKNANLSNYPSPRPTHSPRSFTNRYNHEDVTKTPPISPSITPPTSRDGTRPSTPNHTENQQLSRRYSSNLSSVSSSNRSSGTSSPQHLPKRKRSSIKLPLGASAASQLQGAGAEEEVVTMETVTELPRPNTAAAVTVGFRPRSGRRESAPLYATAARPTSAASAMPPILRQNTIATMPVVNANKLPPLALQHNGEVTHTKKEHLQNQINDFLRSVQGFHTTLEKSGGPP